MTANKKKKVSAEGAVGLTGPRSIVPPSDFVAHGLAPIAGASGPVLQNHGGPILGSVEVVPVYWGAAWASGSNATLTTQLDGFFDYIVASPMIDMLAEYSTATTRIQHGRRLASARVSNSEPGTPSGSGRQVTDAQIQQSLQAWIANHTVPATTANTLYFVFLPPNVVCVGAGGATSCAQMCGYHNFIGNVYYAVIPYVTCNGCVFPGNFLDTLTEVSSHELAEAITDPTLRTWWDPNTGNEIGDICNRQTTRLGGYMIQTEWSNSRNACVIAPQAIGIGAALIGCAAVGCNADGRLEVFGLGMDTAVWHNWQISPNGGWSGWASLGGRVTSDPAVGGNADGRLEVFARGSDNALWHNWQVMPNGGWSGWNTLGGVITSDPFVASNANGRLEVFARGTDNALWHIWQVVPNGGWSGWASLSGVITSDPVVGKNADGRLEAFARGTDNAVWHIWQITPNGGWSGWSSLGGVVTSIPSVGRNADGRMEVFARGTDNALWHNWQVTPNGGWSGWNSLGGVITSDPVVGQNADSRLEAFARGTDKALWHNWQVVPNGGWSGWGSLGGVITSDAIDARNADGRLEVFARGTDNALWHNWQVKPNGGWSGWSSLGGQLSSDPLT